MKPKYPLQFHNISELQITRCKWDEQINETQGRVIAVNDTAMYI